MKELVYENQGAHTYLTYEVDDNDAIDNLCLGMLTNNKIVGIVPTIFTQMDNQKIIKYNVTSKVSVSQFFNGFVNRKRLIGVFKGILNAAISAEDYMLGQESLLLEKDYIFADVTSAETELICLPIADATRKAADYEGFFRNIMFSTRFDSAENCDYVTKIINYLNGTMKFSVYDFKKVIDEIEQEGIVKPQQPVSAPKQAPAAPAAPANAVAPVTSAASVNPTMNAAPARPVIPQAVVPNPVQPSVNPVQPVSPVATPQQFATVTPQNSQSGNIPGLPRPMAAPGKVTPASSAGTVPPAKTADGKEISWMYLMQHYNKENAAAYKAQKEAKKKQGGKAGKSKGKPAAPPTGVNASYAIPGKPAPNVATTLNVPGRPAPSISAVSGTPVAPMAAVTPQQAPQQPSVAPRPAAAPAFSVPQPQGMSANFGETTVLGGGSAYGETTVLSAVNAVSAPVKPYLVRLKNHEKIFLNDSTFKIGKEKSYVDYFIGDNPAISRSHANIVCKNGEYYIVDQNSTNHTYVNGQMVQSNVETRLEHDAKIRLANEEFEFKTN